MIWVVALLVAVAFGWLVFLSRGDELEDQLFRVHLAERDVAEAERELEDARRILREARRELDAIRRDQEKKLRP
jgi:biopolymer transport protein ExbB/TolQ